MKTDKIRGLQIKHCQAGAVTSRQDGSVKISFVTPELLASEAGALLLLHGKNCCVSIVPEDVAPDEVIRVETERNTKTPSARLRAVLYVLFQQQQPTKDTFEVFYANQLEHFINTVKEQLP